MKNERAAQESLSKLFYNFTDYQEKYYNLTKEKLNSDGIIIDLSFFGFFNQINKGKGGTKEFHESFFLVKEGVLGTCIFFPHSLVKTFHEKVFNYFELFYLSDEYLNFHSDHSKILNQRSLVQYIGFFPDEEIAVSFNCGPIPLDGSFLEKNIFSNEPSCFNLSNLKISPEMLINLINTYGLQIKIKLNKSSIHRETFESKVINLNFGINQAWETFYRLINNEHYFIYLKNISKYYPQLPYDWLNLNFSDFKKHLQSLNLGHFRDLDPFDWQELLFGFSFQGDFHAFKRARRINLINKINTLENKNQYLLNNFLIVPKNLFKSNHGK